MHTSAQPSTMIAMRVHAFGDTTSIVAEQLALPAPAPGEILVKIVAAGVGPWDGWIRSGNSVLPQPLPLTLGSDIAGIVVALGSSATGFEVGEAVYGVTNVRFTGGYAQYAACKASMMGHMPVSLSFVEAASAPVITVTAWQMLFDCAKLVKGQSVLVHGAAGNVGRYALQFARAAGLHVIATGAPAQAQALLALGAHEVIGRELPDHVKVDAVLDLVGGPTQARLFDYLAAGSSLVSAVAAPDQTLAAERGVNAAFKLVDVNTTTLDKVSALFDEGELQTWVGAVLPLAEASKAHAMMEGALPCPPGKIILDVPAA